ncbi:MAG: ATPase, T2SS/T4P/T4SS family [Candidatus Aminicenantia bacterium]
MGKAGIITFFGAKGGVGKSILCANLALDIVVETKKNVLLCDVASPFGSDLSQLLDIKGGVSIAKIFSRNLPLNVDLVKTQFARHSAGLFFLPLNTEDPSLTNQITIEKFENLIEFISNVFDFILFDAGSSVEDFTIPVFDYSHLILITLNPETLSVYQAQKTLYQLQSLQYSLNNVQLILNCNGSNPTADPSLIEGLLKRKFLAVFSYSLETVLKAINKKEPFILKDPNSRLTKETDALMLQIIGSGKSEGLLQNLMRTFQKKKTSPQVQASIPAPSSKEEGREASNLRLEIHKKLVEECTRQKINLEAEGDSQYKERLISQLSVIISNIIDMERIPFSSRQERQQFINEIIDEAIGLGPLEKMLKDPEIDEIMVNSPSEIYVEKHGRIQKTPYVFSSEKHLMGVIKRIMSPLGRRIDESSPYQDARLTDGSRVHAIIPPLALKGPTLTIRKFKTKKLTAEELLKLGSLSKEILEFLRVCVITRKNIIISGGTGTGKTTLLNLLSSFIPSHERIITVEDSAELQLLQEHVVRLESRPPNIEGKGEVSIRDLVRNCLRMRPDRIVVGECRGGEALDMLQAMNTGHDGSLTTIHANTSRDALKRLETLVLFTGFELPVKAIREQIASAIDVIVQITRFSSDGSRKITAVTEITGIQGDTLTTQDIFIFKQTGVAPDGKVQGRFEATGLVPRFFDDLQRAGISFSRDIFLQKQ